MSIHPSNALSKFWLMLALITFLGCGTDSDLFVDTVLNQPDAQEESNDSENSDGATEEGSDDVSSVSLSAIDDAFVQGENGVNADIVRVEVDQRTTYLKYDLNPIDGVLVSAHLEFITDSDPGNGVIEVTKGMDNDWTEETLSAQNAPGKGELLGTINASYEIGSTQQIELDVESLETNVISIVLDKKTGNDISIASKENQQNPGPKLVLQFIGTLDESALPEEEPVEDPIDDPDDGGNNSDEVIILNSLKAFPSAFGAAAEISGGRGGAILEVTNLNESGPGSFREAYQTDGKRIIIVKVEGIMNKSVLGSNQGDVTIWGQFAPGRGLTLNGGAWTMSRGGNAIIRHMTAQNGDTNCTINEDCFDALNFFSTDPGTGIYIDHCSFRYGADQTLGFNISNPNISTTISYNLFAEAVPEHNTAVIFTNNLNQGQSVGNHSFSRNMTYNISHRFPNMSGFDGDFEVYNNFYVNWGSRMSRCNGAINVDWHDNFAMAGNAEKSSVPLNKWNPSASEWGGNRPTIYSANNYIEGYDESPGFDQENIWVWFKSSSDNLPGINGAVQKDQQLPSSLFSAGKLTNFQQPQDGTWRWDEIPYKMEASVGHNRGVKANGSPGFFRDDLDSDYITRSLNGTTPSRYKGADEWTNSTFTNTQLYQDSDGDHMPDWFEERHAHLDPNDPSDMLEKHTEWSFQNYRVVNNAGYSNLEICAEFYAGGFETMLDGTNKI